MASFDVAKLLNKITQDIPGINTVLKALAKWDVSALTDVPDGAMQATTDTNNRLTIKKKVSGSYTPVTKLMHDVDTVDGYHASASATPNTVAVRDASGALPGNILGNAATANTASALAAGAVVPVNQGGTGATTASQARANLGAANGADFTAHIAKQASRFVEGHVKLDALAADGSATAAPGGFGLGTIAPASTDFNTVVATQFFRGSSTSANSPITGTTFCINIQYSGSVAVQVAWTYDTPPRHFSRRKNNGVWDAWTQTPNGITDSTSTTSSTIAASATAVKAVNDTASTALACTAPATTTSRGIGRAATLADMEPGAIIENGPAFLDVKGGVVTDTPTAHAVPQAGEDGTLDASWVPRPDYWDMFPPFVPIPIWGATLGGSDGRRAIIPGEIAARENWILCDGGSDGKTGTVPDLRGRYVRGASEAESAGTAGGSETIAVSLSGSTGATTLNTSQMPSHTHTVTTLGSGGNNELSGPNGRYKYASQRTSATGGNGSHTHPLSGSVSGTHTDPHIAMNFFIKVV